MKTHILLVGGYHKARSLAQSLIRRGYQVTAINKTYEDCVKLAEMKSLQVIYGDGSKPYILEEANAANMDIVIALTQSDEDNLVICELCKKRFQTKKTVALLNDPGKTEFFHRMGVDSVVCAIHAITEIIEHTAVVDEITNRIPLGEGRVSIFEVYIGKTSPAVEKKLWELALPQDSIVGCLLRGNISIIPRGDTRILEGDTLVVIAKKEQEEKTIKILMGR